MSNAKKYVIESLGSTGFAVMRGQVAYTQRPDLWATASDCTYDFADKALWNRLGDLHGCIVLLARFAEFQGVLIKILTRSEDDLARRVAQITGYHPTTLIHESELVGEIDPDSIPPRRVGSPIQSDDLHPDVVAIEPRKVCGECEWASTGSSCTNSGESGIERPAMNTPRLCKAFRPKFESLDSRTARQLWPELWALTAAAK